MKISHETMLHRLVAFAYATDRGEARLNRAALLSVGHDGRSALDLLKRGDFNEATDLVGRGAGRAEHKAKLQLSARARFERRPRPPADLINAQDVSRPEGGRLVRGGVSRRLKRP
jgi:hypothetical protein